MVYLFSVARWVVGRIDGEICETNENCTMAHRMEKKSKDDLSITVQ